MDRSPDDVVAARRRGRVGHRAPEGEAKSARVVNVASHGNSAGSTLGADPAPKEEPAPSPGWGGASRLRRGGPWIVGFVTAVVVLGPALAPGPLFNLDLILPPDVPVPRGVWALGPELPRRVPLWLPIAWLSPLIGGDTAGKLLMVAVIVIGFVGMHRFTTGRYGDRTARLRHAELAGYGAAFLFVLNPFFLTRLAVGHLMIALPMALLPWVLPTLLRPGDNLKRTFIAAVALGFAGHYGGAITFLVVAVGLVATRGRRGSKVVAATVLAQLPWLVPGIIVYAEGASIVDSTPFATYIEGIEGVGQLAAGHGFWQPLYQVGWPGGWPVAVVGALLAGLAVAGTPALPTGLRRPLVALAAIGFLAAVASATPGLSDLYVTISRNPVGSVVREGQRLLPLYLVWMAPAAALGARRIASRVVTDADAVWRGAVAAVMTVVPIVAALWLASSGLWGLDSRLRPIDLPPEYLQMRQMIEEQPGTVVGLPWHQYYNLEVDGIRRVLNPLPLYLGGDVLVSSDPELREEDRRERSDPRERQMDAILADAKNFQPVADRMRSLGVRWVVLLHEIDWLKYPGLTTDPGLRLALHAPALDLYEVRDWPGLVVGADGRPVASGPVVEPLVQVDASGAATLNRPYAAGWLRGWNATSASPGGLVALPAGSGPVWYWPSLVTLACSAITYGAVIIVLVRLRVAATPRHALDASREAGTSSNQPRKRQPD